MKKMFTISSSFPRKNGRFWSFCVRCTIRPFERSKHPEIMEIRHRRLIIEKQKMFHFHENKCICNIQLKNSNCIIGVENGSFYCSYRKAILTIPLMDGWMNSHFNPFSTSKWIRTERIKSMVSYNSGIRENFNNNNKGIRNPSINMQYGMQHNFTLAMETLHGEPQISKKNVN